MGSLLLALPFVILFAVLEWRGSEEVLGIIKFLLAPWQGWILGMGLVAFMFFCFLGTIHFWLKNKNATNEVRKDEKRK